MLTNSSTIAFVFLLISSSVNDIISSLISLVFLVSTFSWTLEVDCRKKRCNNYSKKCEHRNPTTLVELGHYGGGLYSAVQYLHSFTFHL